MGKTIVERTKEVSAKRTSAKKSPFSPADQIEKACNNVLEKLKALNLDPQLQSDIQWCLGSYSNDKNPVGLYEMGQRALELFKAEQVKKTKGVTAKLISDLEKALHNA